MIPGRSSNCILAPLYCQEIESKEANRVDPIPYNRDSILLSLVPAACIVWNVSVCGVLGLSGALYGGSRSIHI